MLLLNLIVSYSLVSSISYDDFCIEAERASPIFIKQISKNVPPDEKNGRGIPVTGIRPIVIATFSNICIKNIAQIPETINDIKEFFEFLLIIKSL